MSRNSGFTLLELLVVIAIIGILAAVMLGSLSDSKESALEAAALTEMKSVHLAIEMLMNDTKLYPHKKDRYCPPVLEAGNEVDLSLPSSGLLATDGTYENWKGPYINNILDPWGNPYFLDVDYFCTPGAVGCQGANVLINPEHSVILSCGPDGMLGDDPTNPQVTNGSACAYNDDNIVYVLCNI